MGTAITDVGRDRPMSIATSHAPGQIPESDWDESFDEALAAELRRRATRRRVAFWLVAFVFAAFALLGLFSSLVPGFIGGVLHQGSHAVQGAVVFGMFAVGTVTQVALSRFSSRRVVLAGLVLFLAALALIVAALAQAAMALFLAGTAVGGVAVGAISWAAWPPPTAWPHPGGAVKPYPPSSWRATPGSFSPSSASGSCPGSPEPSRPCSPSRCSSPPCACSPWPGSPRLSRRTRR